MCRRKYEARIAIESLTVLSGTLPPRAMGLVVEWSVQHQQELLALWERAKRHDTIGRLAPLS